jgi:hypothetical protein
MLGPSNNLILFIANLLFRKPLVDYIPPEPPVLTHLLTGDLALMDKLIQGGFGDFQICG